MRYHIRMDLHCGNCGETKDSLEFNKSRARPNGHNQYCRSCQNSRRRTPAYREKRNKQLSLRKEHNKDRRFQRKYGISLEEYRFLYTSQGGVCAICHRAETATTNSRGVIAPRPLSVDHDHDTGKVRGLLCHRCNIALGFLTTRALLKSAYQYLGRSLE